jgi:GDPmannose 4,6-dehydratase
MKMSAASSGAHCALITGITGQDGSYLAELLLEKGYEVYGLVRRVSTASVERIERILERVHLLQGDVGDISSLIRALERAQPNELYNLAAQSFVPASWEQPLLTSQTNALGAANVLEAIRLTNPKIRFYQASSSEMFGKTVESPQNERTPFYPRSPYGVAKLYGHWITVNYRESHGIHASSGLLFNHESPRRGLDFVTRKVTHGAASIALGYAKKLRLGNLEARRDWGFAGDYVRAMWLMLQQEKAGDYVIATGESHSVKDLVQVAFERVGLDGLRYIELDPALTRPAEVDHLVGDASLARERLGWAPSMDFRTLVQTMVDHDMELLQRGRAAQAPPMPSRPGVAADGRGLPAEERGGKKLTLGESLFS